MGPFVSETLLEPRPIVSQPPVSVPLPSTQRAEKRSRPLRGVAVFVIVVAGVIGVAWWRLAATANGRPPAYQTASLDVGRISQTISATGPVQPVTTAVVTSALPGTIKKVHARHNQVVKEGDVLAVLDPETYAIQKEQAEAAVKAAEVGVESMKNIEASAKRQFDERTDLLKGQGTSRSIVEGYEDSYNKAAAQRKAAEGQLEVAKKQLAVAALALSRTEIKAPMGGIVIECDAFVGQSVGSSIGAVLPRELSMAAAAAGTSPRPLFKIVSDLSELEVHANVGEADIGHVRVDQETEFTVDAYPDEKFKGKVTQIRNSPVVFQNVVSYVVVISTQNRKDRETGEHMLRPGMTANIEIMSRDVPSALRVPNAALEYRPTTVATTDPGLGHRWVWVLQNGQPTPHQVRIGLADDEFTEIVESDLKEGDSVITVGPQSDAHSALKNLPVKAY